MLLLDSVIDSLAEIKYFGVPFRLMRRYFRWQEKRMARGR